MAGWKARKRHAVRKSVGAGDGGKGETRRRLEYRGETRNCQRSGKNKGIGEQESLKSEKRRRVVGKSDRGSGEEKG